VVGVLALTQVGIMDVSYFTTATKLELVEGAAAISMTIFCYYYCQSAVVAVREIMLRGPRISNAWGDAVKEPTRLTS
jgi:hypothetical protein